MRPLLPVPHPLGLGGGQFLSLLPHPTPTPVKAVLIFPVCLGLRAAERTPA